MRNWTNLYHDVTVRHYKPFSPFENFDRAVRQLRRAYHRISASSLNTDVDYGSVDNRFAYVYLYGSCHSALVERLMNDYIESEKVAHFIVFLFLLKKGDSLKICSLGGGPGCDVLGLKEAIRSKISSLQIESIVIDKYSQWQTLFDQLSQRMNSGSDRNYFFEADLLNETFRNPCKQIIRRSHIVCLVKFISVVIHKDRLQCLKLIQFILDEMQPGAILLFIDNSMGGFVEMVSRVVEQAPSFVLRYKRGPVSFHLDETPYLLESLHNTPILTNCHVTIYAWQKTALYS